MDDRDRPALRPLRVACMQPTFLPWQGYFALIAAADVFVVLDDFQFRRRTFHHRNRVLFSDGGDRWVTVPASHSKDEARNTLREVAVGIDDEWRRKFRATLDHAYGNAPFHAQIRPMVDDWIGTEWPSLAACNTAFIQRVAGMLGFAPEWRLSSELGSAGQRSARILDLLRRTGAGTYLCARGSLEYMIEDALFPVDDIDVAFQEFEPQPYPQRRAPSFVSHLAVLDALFEVGADATRALVLAGQRAWIPWDVMVAIADATRVAP